MLERLDRWRPANVPEVSKFTEGILQEGLAYVETVLNSTMSPSSEVRADAADSLCTIGMLQVYYSRPDAARVNLTRAVQLWEQLAVEQPDNFAYRRRLLTCYRGLAALAGDEGQAETCWEKVLAVAEELCRLNPDDDLERPTDLAQAHHLLASFLHPPRQNRLAEAEPHYQRAIELMEGGIAKHPEQAGCRSGLADSLGNLGAIYSYSGRSAQAEESFRRADVPLEVLMRDDPQYLIYPISRAAVAQNWGNLAVSTGHADEGIFHCERAVGWSESVLRKEPNMTMARHMALNAHGASAQACESAGRFKAALSHWDRVIALASQPDQLGYRFQRAQVRIKAGDPTRAVAEADALAAEPGCDPNIIYNCACVLALSSRPEKAIALLTKLQSSGYFANAGHRKNLETDEDLNSLRRRDDFTRLVNRLPK